MPSRSGEADARVLPVLDSDEKKLDSSGEETRPANMTGLELKSSESDSVEISTDGSLQRLRKLSPDEALDLLHTAQERITVRKQEREKASSVEALLKYFTARLGTVPAFPFVAMRYFRCCAPLALCSSSCSRSCSFSSFRL